MKVTIPRLVVFIAFMLVQRAFAAEQGYYSQPAVHESRLIFVSEGDLWTTLIPDASEDSTPIIAYRLTSGDGDELYPSISPDGSRLAFSAEYDGNVDVYVMPIEGGAPTRLTFHPGDDHVVGWMPDSRTVLFRSNRRHPHGKGELWRISIGGGMPLRYEFGECSQASFSSTGRRLAFARWSNELRYWKRYRGGTAPDIWVGDLGANTFKNLTNDPSNDLFPMWVAGRVFFLSDRDGTANIWSMSADGGDLKQHTRSARDADDATAIDGYDIRWPYGEARPRGTRIVFCQSGQLALLDVTSDAVRRLDVRIASDRIAPRQRFAPLKDTLTEFTLSPNGKKLTVGARGELMVIPLEGGAEAQLTRTSSTREWGASFLGDDRLVFISDLSGEQQVAVMSTIGGEAPSATTDARQTWLFPPQGSADGRWVAYGDNTLRLHLIDTHTLQERVVDQSESGEITDYRFSPDNQWLAYTKPMPNQFAIIRLYSLRTNQIFDSSDGMSNDGEPRWDPAGMYLYFLSERHFDPVLGSYDLEHIYINTARVIVVPLAENVPPPDPAMARAAGFDMKQWSTAEAGGGMPSDATLVMIDEANNARAAAMQENAADAGGEDPAEGGAAAHLVEVLPLRIDTEGMAARQFVLPIGPGQYSDLEAVYGGVTFIINPVKGLLDDDWMNMHKQGEGRLVQFDLVDGEAKDLAANVDTYALSRDCQTIAVPVENGFTILSISAGEPKAIDLSSAQLRVNIAEEWKQIFDESWRLQRDFYWAPNMVGVNWPTMREKYAALLPRIGTRAELNDVIGEMIGELGTSHTYIWGGAVHDDAKPVNVGLLGADIDFAAGGFRIARIIAAPTYSDELRSPLEAPHLNVHEGNVIVGINGATLRPGDNVYELLQDQAEKPVTLTIADDASGVNRRNIEVETLDSESELRYYDWVRTNYNYVHEQSEGKIGYVHIPDMGGRGLSMFSRYFYPQSQMSAMIVDIRDNGGGFVSQMIIERLRRTAIAYDQPRHGTTYRYPYRALNAHLAAIIDQHAGSDGDIFPAVFKELGLGPLIGMRTWGGVVGIRADKPFVDFGLSTQPEYAWWDAANGWSIENYGVDPDIVVDLEPGDRAAGRDPQLDRAIEYLKGKLAEDPKTGPAMPPYPVRSP